MVLSRLLILWKWNGSIHKVLSKFRSRAKDRIKSVDEIGVDYFIDSVSDDDKDDNQTVINDVALAESRFTPTYLYALNICMQKAIEDPSAVITA